MLGKGIGQQVENSWSVESRKSVWTSQLINHHRNWQDLDS